MNILQPRTITISRAGYTPVAGQPLQPGDTVIASGVACNIYEKRPKGFSKPAGWEVETNTSASMPIYMLSILGQLPGGATIKEGDTVADDLGRTFKVSGIEPHGLGFTGSLEPYEPLA